MQPVRPSWERSGWCIYVGVHPCFQGSLDTQAYLRPQSPGPLHDCRAWGDVVIMAPYNKQHSASAKHLYIDKLTSCLALWNVLSAPRCLQGGIQEINCATRMRVCLHFESSYREDISIGFLRNFGKYLPRYVTSHHQNYCSSKRVGYFMRASWHDGKNDFHKDTSGSF